MPMINLKHEKERLRSECRNIRLSFSERQKKQYDREIFKRVVSLYQYRDASLLLTYVSKDIEADTFMLIEKALSVNAGADAILGLYDKYYDTYFGVPESTYVVQPGDSLTRIAEKMLGDGEKWRVIRDLNRGIIRDPDLIYPGQVLKIA